MEDDELLPISALQHYLYCPRQCALIHVERLWAENRQTAEGRLLHEQADRPLIEKRRGVRTVTAMPLVALALGIHGVADVVEFHRNGGDELPYPVEYKRGRPKGHRADEVQLCAQALCLEEMFKCRVDEGALFYGQTKRRVVVAFDQALRALTLESIAAAREMLERGITPSAQYDPGRCDSCSLLEHCQPKLAGGKSVLAWLKRQLED